MTLSTHVLDTALGRPAAGVGVALEVREGDGWHRLSEGTTDAGGRIGDLLGGPPLRRGEHRLVFDTGAYHAGLGVSGFYPRVTVDFTVTAPEEHHHVPLLLSPHGYTTYRGS